MQQRTTGGADPMGQMPDPFTSPTEFLLAFLSRISMVDKEGFFQRPVREEEAPNYYSIIKQPMCFADMREKINSGSYQTWRQLRDDFNLIHDNAKKFNSNKTLVHRAALNLQKKGTQILAQYELQVRKALAVLHPLGTEQPAAVGQNPASDASGMAADMRIDLAPSPSANTNTSGLALTAEQNGDGMGLGGGGCPRPSLSGPPSPDAAADGGTLPLAGSVPVIGLEPQSFPSILLPPAPRDPIVGYISDEDDQPLLVVGTDAAAATVASAASRSLAGLGPSHALPLDALLTQLRSSAACVPYSFPERQRKEGRVPCSSNGGVDGDADADPYASLGTSTGAGAVPSISKEWRKARRPVELKARWLEMRMRELRSQQERLQAQINWLQQRKAAGEEGVTGSVFATGLGRPGVGVVAAAAGLAAAPCTAERDALSAAAMGFMSVGRVSNTMYFRLRTQPAAGQGTSGTMAVNAPVPTATADIPNGNQTGAADLPHPAPGALSNPGRQTPASTIPPPSDLATSAHSDGLRSVMPPPQTAQSQQQDQQQEEQQQASQQKQQQKQQQTSQQQLRSGRPPVQPLPLLPQQLLPCDEAESDKMLPGAIFASLDLLEQRLSLVRMRLQDTYKFDANRLAVGRTQQGAYASRATSYQPACSGSLTAAGAVAGGQPVLPSGPSTGQGAVKRQSSSQGRRPGGLTVLTRFDSLGMPSCKSTGGGGKRKRSEIELLTGDIGTPLTSYGRTSLDRSASVTTIVIPPVRELAPDEFRARIVAATTWSQHYHTIGPSALDAVPAEIQSVLRKQRRRGFCASGEEYDEDMGVGVDPGGISRGQLPGASDDEGGTLLGGGIGGPMGGYSDSGMGDDDGSSTSSEDTSDEAYAARHRIMEDEEHRRYAAVVAEGQRRRNKGGSNTAGSQQNQGGPSGSAAAGGGAASHAKERAKLGNKTPRYSNSFKLKEGLMLVPPELPPDGPDMILPSATYGYYQPYQPPMLGVAVGSAMPPTPGSTPAVMVKPQPVVVQQAVAQRTSSPPAMLHGISSLGSGIPGQVLQRPLGVASSTLTLSAAPPQPQPSTAVAAAATTTAGLPAASGAPGVAARPPMPVPVPQFPPQPPVQQSQLVLPPHGAGQQAHSVQNPHHAGASTESAVALAAPPPPPPPEPQEQHPPTQTLAPEKPQLQTQGQVMQQQQEQHPATHQQQPAGAQQQSQQPLNTLSRQQERPSKTSVPPQQQQQQEVQHHATTSQPQQQAAAPQRQPSVLSDGVAASGANGCAVKPAAESTKGGSCQPEVAVSKAAIDGSETSAKPTGGGGGAAKRASSTSTEALITPLPPSTAAGQQQGGAAADAPTVGTPATAAAATAGSTNTSSTAAPVTTTLAVEAQPGAAAPVNAAAAAAAALTGTTQAQQVAMSVGASALLGNQAAAAMIAQSPAMSMQFLTGMQGLGAGAGTGGSNNSLSAAATSILLAAAAAASAGGQSAASNLMGNARNSALQQLAAGAPAAQVFANAAAAAAAAAAAGSSAGGASAALGGLGQHGKQQSLFSAAATSRGGMPTQNPLTAAATMSGIGGLGAIGGLPAAFQSFQGFPQSLAGVTGFNLNLAGSAVGLGLQSGQRLSDSLASLTMIHQGGQHLQAHHLQGVPAPAPTPRQGQQMGQAEGGRGAGRGRRVTRTAVVEDDDDEWGEEEEGEEEAAASPSTRTRRSTRAQRRGSNGIRGADGPHGDGGSEAATRQSKRRAAKGAHNWAVLLASDSSDDEDGDEEWGSRTGRRPQESGGRGRGRGRRSSGPS